MKVDFRVKSSIICSICGVKLKKNVTDRKETAQLCYSCHRKAESSRGHNINCNPRRKRIEAKQKVKNYDEN